MNATTSSDRRLHFFAGPSLTRPDIDVLSARAYKIGVELDWRPPVRRGDLRGLLAQQASTAVIIDGRFGQDLAVSVVEIRDALDSGLHIYGCSSMGALRAVECRSIGMVGLGWVYEQYLLGVTEDDAEVALLFDPVSYRPVTVPLCNVRWLLELCSDVPGIQRHRTLLFDTARALGYKERTQTALMTAFKSAGEAGELLATRAQALGAEGWDRKRLDALCAINSVMEEAL